MQVYYSSEAKAKTLITLDQVESHHIAKVMRMQAGDNIQLLDGKGRRYDAVISAIGKKNVQVNVGECVEEKNEVESYLHIGIAPTKNINRFEWFLEKATEIGVAKITPILCDNSERKMIKPERLEKIIIAALKQSQHLYKPELAPIMKLSDFVQQDCQQKYIAYCEDLPDEQLINQMNPNENSRVLIGPEGDFSLGELQLAIQSGYKPVAIGLHRLRTETAGIVVCQIAQDIKLIS